MLGVVETSVLCLHRERFTMRFMCMLEALFALFPGKIVKPKGKY